MFQCLYNYTNVMINVGIVGFGLSGRYLQAPFFLTNPKFNLVKIVTSQELPPHIFVDTERAASIDELLADKSIDLISVCSPSATHFDYAKRALEAGKHVLVEKPVTARAAEAATLFDLAAKLNKVLCVFQNRRYDSDFQTVRKVVESGILGEVLSYEAHFDRYKPVLNAKAWKEAPDATTGILYDLGAHLVDQAICLFGKPDSFSGEAFTQRANSEIDDAFQLHLDFGRVKATLKSSLLVKDQGPKYVVHGTLGSYTKYGMDLQEDHLVSGQFPVQPGFGREPASADGRIRTSLKGLEIEGKVETLPGNWAQLFDNLAEAIRSGKELDIKPWEIVEQIRILDTVKTAGRHNG